MPCPRQKKRGYKSLPCKTSFSESALSVRKKPISSCVTFAARTVGTSDAFSIKADSGSKRLYGGTGCSAIHGNDPINTKPTKIGKAFLGFTLESFCFTSVVVNKR